MKRFTYGWGLVHGIALSLLWTGILLGVNDFFRPESVHEFFDEIQVEYEEGLDAHLVMEMVQPREGGHPRTLWIYVEKGRETSSE